MTKTLLLTLLLSCPLYIYAENTHDCIYLDVSLLNQSDTSCTLSESTIAHGKLSDESHIPTQLSPYQQQHFFVRQTHIGPDVILKYQCGRADFKIESKQNLCLFAAGNVKASILESHGIQLASDTKKGSSWGGQAGQINWRIIPSS